MGWGDMPDMLRMVAALVFVLSLMGGLVFVLKRLGLAGPVPVPGQKKRLKLIETMAVDAKHRLVLVQRDDVQHLIIIGGNGDVVIETDIKPVDNKS